MNLNLVTLDAEAKKVIETPNAQSAKGIIAVHAQPAARKQHVETENRAPNNKADCAHFEGENGKPLPNAVPLT
jgi:hypothetical protein